MINKDITLSPATDTRNGADKNEELNLEPEQNDQPLSTEKTEVKNAHASGDGSIGKDDK